MMRARWFKYFFDATFLYYNGGKLLVLTLSPTVQLLKMSERYLQVPDKSFAFSEGGRLQ